MNTPTLPYFRTLKPQGSRASEERPAETKNPSETNITRKVSSLDAFIAETQERWTTPNQRLRSEYGTQQALEDTRQAKYENDGPPYQLDDNKRYHTIKRVVSILSDRHTKDLNPLDEQDKSFYEGQVTDLVTKFSGRDYNALMILAHAAQKGSKEFDAMMMTLGRLHNRSLKEISPELRVMQNIEILFEPLAKVDGELRKIYEELQIPQSKFNYWDVTSRGE
jgi:hypothetical protein